jgi:4-amino-4-deoxy-L-arabinose transferase-like glycosyltransferase
VLAWFAATAWLRPLALPDEGRYAGVAWEMLRSGQWAVPTLDGLPYFHKPPLFYWMAAAAMQVFGPSELPVRMPSIVAAAGAAFALYCFVCRWGDARQARWTLALLATQPFFFGAAQFANMDMLVAGCVTLTVLACAHSVLLHDAGKPYRHWLAAAYGMAGFGFLAKGLIGIVLPALVMAAWLSAARRPRDLARIAWLPGLGLLAAIALPWCVEMQRRYVGFFDYFIVHQHFERYATAGFNNPQPFWFYPVAVLVLALPSSMLLPWAVRLPVKGGSATSVRLLMWCWLATVLLFFSLPKSKLVGYAVPALPPLAVLLASGLLQGSPLRTAHQRLLLAVAAAVCVGTVAAIAAYPRHSSKALGTALSAERRTGEPVVFVDRYPFDLPLYAKLEAAPYVTGNWSAQQTWRDDWRKELFDAGGFAPDAASTRLIGMVEAESITCRARTSWFVATADQIRAARLDHVASAVARTTEQQLWRIESGTGRCSLR